MEAESALEVAQQEVDVWTTRLRREQEQVSAVAMPGARTRTPQSWAAGLAAALPPEVARQFQSWLASVSPDAMGLHLLENGEGRDVDLDGLEVCWSSATSATPSSMAAAPSAFAPSRAAAQKARRDPYLPPQLRGRGPREDGGREVSPETPVPREASQTPPAL